MVIHSSQEKKSVLQTLLKSSEYSQSLSVCYQMIFPMLLQMLSVSYGICFDVLYSFYVSIKLIWNVQNILDKFQVNCVSRNITKRVWN